MVENRKKDIAYMKEWMQKEPQLPDPFDDEVILKFLHSCYYSLEQTKKCIDRFCTSRHEMPQVYTQRDPTAAAVTTDNGSKLFWNFQGAAYECGDIEMLIIKLDEDVNKFNFVELLKGIAIKVDYWVLTSRFLAEGHAAVLDFEHFSMKHIPKVNLVLLKDFIMYLLEGAPVRVKKVFVINAPPATDVFYNLVKPILPQELKEIISISPDTNSLCKYVDKKFLPKEYGGNSQSLEERTMDWRNTIIKQHCDMFKNEELWKGDGTKRPKKADLSSMNGSFRTLDID